MSDFYTDTKEMYVRFGLSSERPVTPPDKSALFWALDTAKLYGVTDDMAWYIINPSGTGEAHIHITDIATNNVPNALMWQVSLFGAFIWECRFVVDSAWDLGITLSVGDAGDNERLMKTSDILPQVVNDNFTPYTTTPMYQYGAAAGIYLYQNSFSGTGHGTLYIAYDENPNTVV